MKTQGKLFTDGGARGNPGPAAAGIIIKDMDDNVLHSFGKYLGELTNNQAEYRALIIGLQKAADLKISELNVFMDSELIIKQLKREYKVKDKELAVLFVKAWNLSLSFTKISFTHILRAKNKLADEQVNKVLDNM